MFCVFPINYFVVILLMRFSLVSLAGLVSSTTEQFPPHSDGQTNVELKYPLVAKFDLEWAAVRDEHNRLKLAYTAEHDTCPINPAGIKIVGSESLITRDSEDRRMDVIEARGLSYGGGEFEVKTIGVTCATTCEEEILNEKAFLRTMNGLVVNGLQLFPPVFEIELGNSASVAEQFCRARSLVVNKVGRLVAHTMWPRSYVFEIALEGLQTLVEVHRTGFVHGEGHSYFKHCVRAHTTCMVVQLGWLWTLYAVCVLLWGTLSANEWYRRR